MRLPQFLAAPAFAPILFGLLFTACSSSEPAPRHDLVSQYTGLLPVIMENDSNLFHGIALGMTPEEVRKNMSKKDSLPVVEQRYLQFEGHLAPNKEYAYDCTFDEKGLKDITLDVHLKDEKNADALFNDFKRYFTQKYGPPVDTLITFTWEEKTGKRPAKIQLQQEPDYNYGKLTIAFFDKTFEVPQADGDSSMILP